MKTTASIKRSTGNTPLALAQAALADTVFEIGECPRCFSKAGHWHGYKLANNNVIFRRRSCTTCNHWFYGKAYIYERRNPDDHPHATQLTGEQRNGVIV